MHTYFVSFHNGVGFGSCAIRTNAAVTSWEHVNALRDLISAVPESAGISRDDLVVLNFILLSGPKEAA